MDLNSTAETDSTADEAADELAEDLLEVDNSTEIMKTSNTPQGDAVQPNIFAKANQHFMGPDYKKRRPIVPGTSLSLDVDQGKSARMAKEATLYLRCSLNVLLTLLSCCVRPCIHHVHCYGPQRKQICHDCVSPPQQRAQDGTWTFRPGKN
jgi:hypothetical protein